MTDAMSLWRAGRKLAAIALIREAPTAMRAELRPRLAAATTALARDLARVGEIVDSREALYLLDAQDRAAASAIAIKIALEAMARDWWWFATQARMLVSEPAAVAALTALAEQSDELRTVKLLNAASDSRLEGRLRRIVLTCAALSFARRGNHARASATLPEAETPDERLLATLLASASGRGAPIDATACDWRHAIRACSHVPGLLARLTGQPRVGNLQASAAYWIARGQRDAATPLLAAAQREQSDDWRLARNLATLGYCRGLEAAPGIDAEVWRICIAQTAALVENRRWLELFVMSRLTVYGVDLDLARCCEDARTDIGKLLDDQLAGLAVDAHRRGDPEAIQLAERLRAELVRERHAAAALWSAGLARTATERKLAFGPLFAERAGCAVPPFNDAVTRRWFSELGIGAAFSVLGDVEAARAATLDVILRWSPPDAPGPDEFARCNPGYASLSDPTGRLRRDAGSLLVDIELDALRGELSAKVPACDAIASRIAAALRKANAFGEGDEARTAVRRAILTRCDQLVATKDMASVDASLALLQTAVATGIDDLDGAIAEGHLASAQLLMAEARHVDAAAPLEAAWELDRTTAWVPQQLIASLLLLVDALRDEGRGDEADEAIARARVVVASAGEAFFASSETASLGRCVAAVAAGARASTLYRIKQDSETGAEIPEQARRELAAYEQARQRGDSEAASEHAARALEVAPASPEVAALAVECQLEIARTLAAQPGAELYERARTTLTAALKRTPAHRQLREASAIVARDAVLYSGRSDPITMLHRQALRCAVRGNWSDASIVLRTILGIAPVPDPLVLALYAEALIRDAAARCDDDIQDLLRAARSAIAAGQVLAPRDARWRRLRGDIENISAGGVR